MAKPKIMSEEVHLSIGLLSQRIQMQAKRIKKRTLQSTQGRKSSFLGLGLTPQISVIARFHTEENVYDRCNFLIASHNEQVVFVTGCFSNSTTNMAIKFYTQCNQLIAIWSASLALLGSYCHLVSRWFRIRSESSLDMLKATGSAH